jgi:uncharacterized membrane protein (DUF485 family)
MTHTDIAFIFLTISFIAAFFLFCALTGYEPHWMMYGLDHGSGESFQIEVF